MKSGTVSDGKNVVSVCACAEGNSFAKYCGISHWLSS